MIGTKKVEEVHLLYRFLCQHLRVHNFYCKCHDKCNNLLSISMQVPSHALMGIPHSASSLPLSALGDACVRRDLTAIHEILDSIGYKDDEGVTNEVCNVLYEMLISIMYNRYLI